MPTSGESSGITVLAVAEDRAERQALAAVATYVDGVELVRCTGLRQLRRQLPIWRPPVIVAALPPGREVDTLRSVHADLEALRSPARVVALGDPNQRAATVALELDVVAYVPRVPGSRVVLAAGIVAAAADQHARLTLPPSGWRYEGKPLTEREVQVLGLMADGLTNEAIGARLVLSGETVKTHALRIARKLGTRTRNGTVAAAMRYGFVK